MIDKSARMYGRSELGEGCRILGYVIIGYPDSSTLEEIRRSNADIEGHDFEGAVIGRNAVIRSGTVIYCRVRIGDDLRTGHNVLIREKTMIGDGVLIGTNAVVEGNTTIGSRVSIQSGVFIPTNTTIEDLVFIGPNAVLTNDRYPCSRTPGVLKGPLLRKGASIGANAVILPGIEIGEGSMVAAGATVTGDVPPWKLAVGSPARIRDLPQDLRVLNNI